MAMMKGLRDRCWNEGGFVKKAQEQTLWNDVFLTATELEVFDPRLSGLEEQLKVLAVASEMPSSLTSWINHAKPCLMCDTVIMLALKLNEIAGVYFSRGELRKAKSVCECTLALYSEALGVDHADTMVIAANLQRLQESLSKYKAKPIDKRSHKRQ